MGQGIPISRKWGQVGGTPICWVRLGGWLWAGWGNASLAALVLPGERCGSGIGCEVELVLCRVARGVGGNRRGRAD